MLRDSNGVVDPILIPRSDVSGQRSAAPAINQPHNSGAVHSRRNRLAKAQVAEPFLLAVDLGKPALRVTIQIEKYDVVFEPRPQIAELVPMGLLFFAQRSKIFSTQGVEHLRVARLKPDHLGVLCRYCDEGQLIKI